jgi:acetyl esterase
MRAISDVSYQSQPVLDEKTSAFLKFLKDSGRPELHMLSVEEARANFVRGQSIVPVVMPPAEVESREISVEPNGCLKIYLVRPSGAKTALPAIMYFHGGGWVVGDFSTHERTVREIAAGAQAAVVFVEYTRSPEAHFPVANEEAYAATRWVAEHGAELGIDGRRIAVAGDSAGGNMATMVALLARQRGGPRLAAQILYYPSTGGDHDLPSRHQFDQGYFLTNETSLWFWSHYMGDTPRHMQKEACPLGASLEELTGLPPALIITAECDLLRDEGEAYAGKLTQAGVPVIAARYIGAIHGFNVINALADTLATRTCLAQTCSMLRRVFEG